MTSPLSNPVEKHFSIQEIETAINKLLSIEKGNQELGPLTRELADVYGEMIFNKVSHIAEAALSAGQLHAMKSIPTENTMIGEAQ